MGENRTSTGAVTTLRNLQMRKGMTAPVVGFLLCCGGISFFYLCNLSLCHLTIVSFLKKEEKKVAFREMN